MFHITGKDFHNYYLGMVPVLSGVEHGVATPAESVGCSSSWDVGPTLRCDGKIFNHVTRYLVTCESIFESASGRRVEILQLCANLAEGNWDAIGENYKESLDDLPKDALVAFHEGKVLMTQFCSITFFWSLKKSGKDLSVVPLFLGDSVNPQAKNLVEQTMKKSGKLLDKQPDFLDEGEMSAFFARMHAAPKSEQFFFLSEEEPGFIGSISTITQVIYQNEGINVFNRCLFDGSIREMSPSFSMVQNFLKTYAGDRAIKITPVIGLSSVEDIVANLKTGTRDMALPFPGVFIPDSADTLAAPSYRDFFLHDVYHAILCSEIPHEIRPAFSLLSDIILEIKESSSDIRIIAFLDEFFHRIVDNEHAVFRKHNSALCGYSSPSLHIQFMWAVLAQYGNAINRLRSEKKEGVSFDDLRNITSILQTAGTLERFFEAFREKAFFRTFGIDPTQVAILRPFSPVMPMAPEVLDLHKLLLIHIWKDLDTVPSLAETLVGKQILEGLEISLPQKDELVDFICRAPAPNTIDEYDIILSQITEKAKELEASRGQEGIQKILDNWTDPELMKMYLDGCLLGIGRLGVILSESQVEEFRAYFASQPAPADQRGLEAILEASINHATKEGNELEASRGNEEIQQIIANWSDLEMMKIFLDESLRLIQSQGITLSESQIEKFRAYFTSQPAPADQIGLEALFQESLAYGAEEGSELDRSLSALGIQNILDNWDDPETMKIFLDDCLEQIQQRGMTLSESQVEDVRVYIASQPAPADQSGLEALIESALRHVYDA